MVSAVWISAALFPVSVNERTREIGLRRSIGATGRAILLQFLSELVLLSVIGGLRGVVPEVGGRPT